jgi:hypothetical protein
LDKKTILVKMAYYDFTDREYQERDIFLGPGSERLGGYFPHD